jgi:hypothetical protein
MAGPRPSILTSMLWPLDPRPAAEWTMAPENHIPCPEGDRSGLRGPSIVEPGETESRMVVPPSAIWPGRSRFLAQLSEKMRAGTRWETGTFVVSVVLAPAAWPGSGAAIGDSLANHPRPPPAQPTFPPGTAIAIPPARPRSTTQSRPSRPGPRRPSWSPAGNWIQSRKVGRAGQPDFPIGDAPPCPIARRSRGGVCRCSRRLV